MPGGKTIWTTQLCGHTYLLDDEGQLQPARKESRVSTTHLQRMTDNPNRAHSAVAEELHALQQRLTEQKEQDR